MALRPLRPVFRALGLCMLALGAGLAQAADEFLYTVRAGDHPWNIAQRYCKDPSYGLRLAKLNRIPNDRRMQPGTQLRIPAEWLKLQSSRVRVLAVRGDTRLQTGAGAGRAAVEGESLLPGSSLLTGPSPVPRSNSKMAPVFWCAKTRSCGWCSRSSRYCTTAAWLRWNCCTAVWKTP